ncbi:MAG: DUF86 domain-containing protein [Dehalococcoidia bacterium]
MQPKDEAVLLDIAFCAERIAAISGNVTYELFALDVAVQEQVQYRLIVMGEAVKRLSAEFRGEHTAVTWQSIAGARDVLIHGYERVNLRMVWEMASLHVPSLLDYVRPLLPPREPR